MSRQNYFLFLRKRKYDEGRASSTVVKTEPMLFAPKNTVEGVVVLPSDEEDEVIAGGETGEGSGCNQKVESNQLETSTPIKIETVEAEEAILFKGISIDCVIELSDEEMTIEN